MTDKYLQEAIETYERFVAQGGPFYMDASTLMDIEEHYEKQGMEFEAEQLMRTAEKLHPESEDVLAVKAFRLKVRGRWNEAMQVIKRIANQQARDVQVFLAEWETAQGFPEKAEKRIRQQMPETRQPEDYDWLLNLAEVMVDYGYYGRTVKLIEEIPDNYPLRRRADELLAECHWQLHHYDQTIEVANRMIDADPYDTSLWGYLADVQQKCGNYEDCIESCDYALAIDPNMQQAMSLKVFATFGLQRFDEAMQLCRQYMPLMPDDYTLRMYAGEQCYIAARFEEASGYLHEALRLCSTDNPDHKRILTDLALTLSKTDRLDEVEELMLTLTQTNMTPSECHYHTAGIMLEGGHTERAVEQLAKSYFAPPHGDGERFRVMEMLTKQGWFKPAERLWRYFVEHDLRTSKLEAYAYVTVAMRGLHDAESYLGYLKLSLQYCPLEIIPLLFCDYKTHDPDEIFRKAQQECAAW